MEVSVLSIVLFVVGLGIGGFLSWIMLRNKIALSNATGFATGQVERTALSEQLRAALQEIAGLQERVTSAAERSEKLQEDLDRANRECAQLGERSCRLAEVEAAHKVTGDSAEGLKKDLADLRETNGRLDADLATTRKQLFDSEETRRQISADRDELLRAQGQFRATIAELKTTLDKERSQSQEKLALLNEAREELTNQFKTLASEILDDKSKKFTEQNQANLGQLLNPLQEKIKAFQAKVEEVYINEGKDRSALAEHIRGLIQLNTALSQDAQNLTLALKGDRKALGNWGEIILDDVLEKAGLLPDQHYVRQGSVKSENGQTHVIPDVVIRLPGGRNLVIDSKMTLPDYRSFASAETEDDRTAALRRHLTSIRAHIKGLSEKNYHALYDLDSLDFVVMFIPLEPAFMVAVTNDGELFHQAWEKNVLLVSPSTLLFVVRTVAYLWRQEGLSRNARDISNRGAELYDKLVGFVGDLQKVGERIQQAQDSYNEARKKFSQGSGNVIRQAEMLKKLGVKSSKTLPPQWADPTIEEAIATPGDELT
jgi:DNA recombination protein RmuC